MKLSPGSQKPRIPGKPRIVGLILIFEILERLGKAEIDLSKSSRSIKFLVCEMINVVFT